MKNDEINVRSNISDVITNTKNISNEFSIYLYVAHGDLEGWKNPCGHVWYAGRPHILSDPAQQIWAIYTPLFILKKGSMGIHS